MHGQKTAQQQRKGAFPTTSAGAGTVKVRASANDACTNRQSTVATPSGRISPFAPLSCASALKRVGPEGGKTTVTPKV